EEPPDATPPDTAPAEEPSDAAGQDVPPPEEPDGSPWTPDPELGRAMDELLGAIELKGASVGIFALEYPSGRIVYQHRAEEAMKPASVAKVLTAAAFLERFGPDHRFTTTLAGDGTSLWLVGGGDPGLGRKQLSDMAAAVKAAGVEQVQRVYVDAGLYDAEDLPPHYATKKTDEWYRASVGAAAAEEGAVTVRVTPGKRVGGGVLVELIPASDYFLVDSNAVTTEEDRGDLEVRVREARGGRAGIHVTGSLPMESKGAGFRKRVPSPNLLAGWLLIAELRKAGVRVEEREPLVGRMPEGTPALHTHRSHRVQADLSRMLRDSNNFVAEQLAKMLGSECTPRTWECSLEHMRDLVRRIGLRGERFRLENGSGLYDANRLSPRQLVRFLLEAYNRSRIAGALDKAMAVSGESGTLLRRLKEVKGRVHGKTGTLDGVTCLAGRASLSQGRQLWFAILFNDAKGSAPALRRLQDRMLLALMGEWRPGTATKRSK
ncbi:MAG: D-alanyl-D-alanine carboxypeptidase/D-alanyl-D-alanine-endopeptidase, partial [Deltaproteobacteria bacterium]|nr:D-alanyl-D-alanine carboxypeptidase/D-alanyl-D-alanine-endopeptidase [Deltaproteobacteria bacterium]